MPQDLRKADLVIGRMHIFRSKFSSISFLLLWKNSKPFKWGCSWCHALLMIRCKKTPMYMVKREMQYHQQLEIQMNYCLYILFAYLVLLNALFNCHLVNRLLSNYRLLKICKWNTNVDIFFFNFLWIFIRSTTLTTACWTMSDLHCMGQRQLYMEGTSEHEYYLMSDL